MVVIGWREGRGVSGRVDRNAVRPCGFEDTALCILLMEGLVGLSPKRTSRLLGECRSVKVKRLFL